MTAIHSILLLASVAAALSLAVIAAEGAGEESAALEAPASAERWGVAEFTLRVARPAFGNPFTEARFSGAFTQGDRQVRVEGFCDAQDGSVFRLRFSPDRAGATYGYALRFEAPGIVRCFSGVLRSTASRRPGPVVVDPERPKHFRTAGSGKPFYHLGYTAYHLFDPSNTDAQVDATIDYCARHRFNKVRFLLTGYPRDTDTRSSADPEHGVPTGRDGPNYGALPGRVNALPAWLGEPHRYDFTRFNVAYWRRVERGIRRMRERGIVATCIVTIEKQDLPREIGALSEDEMRLYRYAVARLAAFDNVWWDLGNEHNEYRNRAWGDRMGAVLKEADPYDRLASAHGYAEFLYPESSWADFIVTQQYGDEEAVHTWALRYAGVPKPYVNEEYGYEGEESKPGHGQNADWTRRCHWSIAMAGGYATYGDWSGGVSTFYMGVPGRGRAALQLKHLRAFFEALPYRDLKPADRLTSRGFCLAQPGAHVVLYLPRGGAGELDLSGQGTGRFVARWFDPRTGAWRPGPALRAGANRIQAPSEEDWALHVRVLAPR